ncbi:MAG: NADH-quinone oxidoreductase subunit NuoF [Mycoplasma sp.]|nr:NADH-quinone oxidoreductase subunit NuoF [Candidatus Hennigella equi]
MALTIKDLEAIKAKLAKRINDRKAGLAKAEQTGKKQILVCASTGCLSNKAIEVTEAFEKSVRLHNLSDKVEVSKTGCHGLCSQGPVVLVYPEGIFYRKVKPTDVVRIVEEHLIEGNPVKELIWPNQLDEKKNIIPLNKTHFYKHQVKIALKNAGVIDPENIDEYIACDGYFALNKVLTSMSQDDVIKLITDSQLRGRGGGGFPTGLKWSLTKKSVNKKKYVCCNADEGDPGAFMDRSILEADPHSIIEAMAIAAYAVGADEGFIYVRAEYPIAVQRLETAIAQAKKYGFLGNHIFGTNFNFKLSLRLGSGAFVCGEETALMTSVEGNRGEPRPRPPFPAVKGLFGKPTLLNNVETYANITRIILNGPQWFTKIGTEKSKGTKVFAVGGKINNTGLIEVPMGTTLRTIIYDICGGVPNEKEFKAAQTGGPSGGCIPAKLLDTPIDYENLTAIGSMMGSGGLIVMDEDNCMVDICKFYMEFCVEESCGKCVPCRIGNKRLLELLTKFTEGKAKESDIAKLEELSAHIKATSACGLGQSSPNPILSTLKYFRDEYIAHTKGQCPAGACKSLTGYYIDPAKCKGCSSCARNCPVQAISGTIGKPFKIDQVKCIKCGACARNCRFQAISKK